MQRAEAVGAEDTGAGSLAPAETFNVETSNNFDLLRLGFAGLVFAYHLALLPGLAAWQGAAKALSIGAELGVQGFFVLSGYLVYGSLRRSRGLLDYAAKRARRLYPAYAVVVLACGLVALVASAEARADLAGVARYLGWNLVFLNFMEPQLPGLFANNPAQDVNGALWTIKVEVMFYVLLPLIAAAMARGRFWAWGLGLALYVFGEAWRLGFIDLGEARSDPQLVSLALQLPGQIGFFMAGVLAHHGPRGWFRSGWLSGLAAIVLFGSMATPWLEPLRALSLGWVCMALAIGLPRIVDAARFGDLSYGVYIVHFPIIQAMTAAGLFAAAPGPAAVGALLLVLAAALAMWWGVERPALRRDSAYRRA